MDSTLGLAEQHKLSVVELLHFFRFKRSQSVKGLQSLFQDLIDSRLNEDTFTCEEVREMLIGLCAVAKGDLESELINTSHTHVLLLQQLFQQAEKWHLMLKPDISVLENQELLDAIAQFERTTVAEQQLATPTRKYAQLEPVNSAGGEKLLQLEIKRLEDENKKLNDRIRLLETKASSALSEKDRLKSDLAASSSLQSSPEAGGGERDGERDDQLTELQGRIQQLQDELTKTKSSEGSAFKEELTQTAHELLRVTAELEKTKQELEKKFSETSQYITMRKMLATKNDQIKQLRTQLSAKE